VLWHLTFNVKNTESNDAVLIHYRHRQALNDDFFVRFISYPYVVCNKRNS